MVSPSLAVHWIQSECAAIAVDARLVGKVLAGEVLADEDGGFGEGTLGVATAAW